MRLQETWIATSTWNNWDAFCLRHLFPWFCSFRSRHVVGYLAWPTGWRQGRAKIPGCPKNRKSLCFYFWKSLKMQIPPFFVRIPGGSWWIAKDEDIFFWIFQMGILRGIWPFIDELEMGFKTFQNFSSQMEQFPRPSYCGWNPAPEMYETLRGIFQGQTQKCEANHHLLVELGSLSHYLSVFFTSQVVVWDFFHQQYDLRFPAFNPRQKAEKLRMRCVGLARLARDQPFLDPRNHPILKCELCEGIHFRILKAWDATLGHCDLQG